MRYLLKRAKEIFSIKKPDLEALITALEPGPTYIIFLHKVTMSQAMAANLARALKDKKGIDCVVIRAEVPPVVYELEIPEKDV